MKMFFEFKKDKYSSSKNDTKNFNTFKKYVEGVNENKPNYKFADEKNNLVEENNMDWQEIVFDLNAQEVVEPSLDYSDEFLENAQEEKSLTSKLVVEKRDASNLLVNYLPDKTFNELQESGLPKKKEEIYMMPNTYNATSNFTIPFSSKSSVSNVKFLKNVNNTIFFIFLYVCLF